ncbi:hypothetical protein OFM35_29975, partial [Escherichia coli]|nr:hypothetical protein [Escherichia coli]
MVRDFTRNGAIIIALGQKPFHIGTCTVRVQHSQNMYVTGRCQFNPRKECQWPKFRQVAGAGVPGHILQLTLQHVDPGSAVMIADYNTIDMLFHISQKPLSGADVR